MNCQNPKEYKIFSQISSDLQMINRGYSKDSRITEDEKFSWCKEIDIEEYPDFGYSIHIKAKVDENGFFEVAPTIWFENMRVEIGSFVDIDIDIIENLAKDLLNTISKHNFI
jgi:hypothetical protein